MRKKTLISWSTGKDSAYALTQIDKIKEYDVCGLLCTITEQYDRVSMHSSRHELLLKQAEQLDLPVYKVFIPSICTNEIYEERMRVALNEAIHAGISHIIFGDLFLENIRNYRETKLAPMNIIPVFPLWQRDTKQLAQEMIDAGMKAVITCVDPKKLDASFAGRDFDKSFLQDLPEQVDPCGEHGEFHTFVYDGPMFRKAIDVAVGDIVERDGFIFADVL